MIKVNYCGGAAQERMVKNGWKFILHREGPENPTAWQNFAKEICDFINESIEED